MPKALERVVRLAGAPLGTPARTEIAGALEVVYVLDPEGNVIELQRWR